MCVLSEYLCHVYVRNDNLGAVVIADGEYPSRVCFTLLDKVRSDVFTSQQTTEGAILTEGLANNQRCYYVMVM